MTALSFNPRVYPAKVNLAILFLCLGWATHFLFYFTYLSDQFPPRTTYLQLGVGIGICVLVAAIKQWARRMCIFFNIGMIAMHLLYALNYHMLGKRPQAAVTGLVVVLFVLATGWLLSREVARYFTERNPLPETGLPPADVKGGDGRKKTGGR